VSYIVENDIMKQNQEIEYLVIWKNLNNVATAAEQKELQLWLADNDKNQTYYLQLKSGYETEKVVVTKEDMVGSWQKINGVIDKKRTQVRRWLQYAAVICIPLLVAGSLFWYSADEKSSHLAHHIQPGTAKAILKLHNGEMISLDSESRTLIENVKGEIVGTDSLDVLRLQAKPVSKKIEYNTISVPRGGEYQLVLADGSKVWLNSATELRFPVSFSGETRDVYLSGEAFFEVESNASKPFLVHTSYSDVKVYGTEFNVMSYPDDKVEKTTLVEGSVAVIKDGKEQKIQPGEQSSFIKGKPEMIINTVDTDLYTAWCDGVFRFEEMPLDQLVLKLARWYDVNFFFVNESVKKKRFTGAIRRQADFEIFMKVLGESTQVEIIVIDNNVQVRSK